MTFETTTKMTTHIGCVSSVRSKTFTLPI